MKLNILLIFLSSLIILTNGALVPKNIAGLPSEFKDFYLPNPKSVAQSSDSSLISVFLTESQTTNDILEWTGTIPVDSDKVFSITLFSKYYKDLTLEAFPKGSSATNMGKVGYFHQQMGFGKNYTVKVNKFGIDGARTTAVTYSWKYPTVGDWTIKVSGPSDVLVDSHYYKLKAAGDPQVLLLVSNPSEFKIYSYLNSYNNLFVNQSIQINAMIYSSDEYLVKGRLPTPIKFNKGSAQVNLVAPDGSKSTINMFDDGLHADGSANDGLFGAFIQPSEEGNYDAQVLFKGITPEIGVNMLRSNQHVIPITYQYMDFTGNVFSQQISDDEDGSVNIYYEVDFPVSVSQVPSVRVYSEVWGTGADGQSVPVAWIGGVSSVQQFNGLNTVSALLNGRYIALAQATAPFSVKNVIISDMNTFVPLCNQSLVSPIKMVGEYADVMVRAKKWDPPLNVITKEMRDGKMPKELAARFGKQPSGNGKLVLVHGYCADDNPWPIEDFTNAVQFEDFDENRSNDEFAKMVGDFGAQFTDGFSIIGHSQGGTQALHLLTYYHSGLDLSQAYQGRVVQSVGTPYQGTALAGTLASIGGVVGIGCSSNDDLTLDGASLWLNSIPLDKRQLVYYTTTQYKTGGLVNYCNLAANAVLSWPNDGVVANEYAELEGGNFVGNFKGWCHSDDMKSDPQTDFHENNKEMDKLSVW
eukprot:gene2733-3392_t